MASDCQNIIKKIQSPHLDRSHVGAIVCDVKNLVREVSVSFMYIQRSCNEAAHVMARLADQFVQFGVMRLRMQFGPSFVTIC